MKIVVLIVRLLLGLFFFVFGLNAFLQFLKGPIPGGLAGQFVQALFQSHYVLAVGAVQVVGGALLLINRYVPFALTILGPVLVNILLYYLLLNHEGIGGALVATGILACVVLPLSPVLFRDLYRKDVVCVVTAKCKCDSGIARPDGITPCSLRQNVKECIALRARNSGATFLPLRTHQCVRCTHRGGGHHRMNSVRPCRGSTRK